MSGIGSGRGRGWLRLEKTNNEPQRPGVESNKFESSRSQIIPQEEKKYDKLLSKIDCLNPNDDGILLNNKIKHIREMFLEICPTEDEMRKAGQAINGRCLRDEVFIEKIILLLTSAYFYNKQIKKEHKTWKDALRREFINHLQDNFENKESLRKTTPAMFYNSLKLISSYFWNYKKLHPTGYPSLESIAVIGYLEALLDFGEPYDIKMMAMMACEQIQVLVKLYDKKDAKLLTLLDKIKLAVVSDEKFSKKDKILLFFVWDLIRHKYQISPEDLEFYKSNLGEDDIKDILMKYNLNKPDIECPENTNGRKNDYCTWNDLRSSHKNFHLTPTDISNNTSANNSSYELSMNSSQSKYSKDKSHSSNFTDNFSILNDSDQMPQSIKSINLNENKDFVLKDNQPNNHHQNQGEKIGRPILGIGARLKKN